MPKDIYQSIENDVLGWKCIEPIIERFKGKDPIAKSEVYASLTLSQRALFMFFVFDNHSESVEEFYWFSSYFARSIQSWKILKRGVQIFQDEQMLAIYEQVETMVKLLTKQPNKAWRDALLSNLEENSDLHTSLINIYGLYKQQIPYTLNRIHEYIRTHTGEFIELTNK